jgi:hypothetical protein
MALLSFPISKFNQWFGPVLLRYGIRARFLLSFGILRDNPYFDAFCGIPVALKLMQLEVYHECKTIPTTGVMPEDEETKKRLQILEKYLRPALVPHECWSDIRLWQFHYRIIKWIRTEYLIAKYRPSLRRILFDESSTYKSIRKSQQLSRDFFGVQYYENSNLFTKVIKSFQSLFNNKQQQLGKNNDDRFVDIIKLLPSSNLLTKAFDMVDWESDSKNIQATRSNMVQIANKLGGTVMELRGGGIGVSHVDDLSTNVAHLSLEEILEVSGGHVMQCNAFNALCEDADIYQFWTREYIDLLGRYVLERSMLQPTRETIILDVGAGDGILAQLLREFMHTESNRTSMMTNLGSTSRIQLKSRIGTSTSKKRSIHTSESQNPINDNMIGWTKGIPTIVASDSGAWGISPIAPIQKQTVQEAIDSHKANTINTNDAIPIEEKNYHLIVLCSWMPMNEDWTYIFRNNPHVDEYILIGECDDGQCGDNWLTWGNLQNYDNNDFNDDKDVKPESTNDILLSSKSTQKTISDDTGTESETPTPQYKLDGFERYNLDEFSKFQFSRFDCRTSKTGRTISFRRL